MDMSPTRRKKWYDIMSSDAIVVSPQGCRRDQSWQTTHHHLFLDRPYVWLFYHHVYTRFCRICGIMPSKPHGRNNSSSKQNKGGPAEDPSLIGSLQQAKTKAVQTWLAHEHGGIWSLIVNVQKLTEEGYVEDRGQGRHRPLLAPARRRRCPLNFARPTLKVPNISNTQFWWPQNGHGRSWYIIWLLQSGTTRRSFADVGQCSVLWRIGGCQLDSTTDFVLFRSISTILTQQTSRHTSQWDTNIDGLAKVTMVRARIARVWWCENKLRDVLPEKSSRLNWLIRRKKIASTALLTLFASKLCS